MSTCQFCKAEPKHTSPVDAQIVISYQCGTVAGDQEPRTVRCWRKYTEKLEKENHTLRQAVFDLWAAIDEAMDQ